jgi:hypothetical protein
LVKTDLFWFGPVRFFNIKIGKTYIQTDRVFLTIFFIASPASLLFFPANPTILKAQLLNKQQICDHKLHENYHGTADYRVLVRQQRVARRMVSLKMKITEALKMNLSS